MKAVALTRYLPIDDPRRCSMWKSPPGCPGGHDLLVRVEAVSVNPVDTKVRSPKPQVEAQPKVLGYDAAGMVEAVGARGRRIRSRVTASTTPATSPAPAATRSTSWSMRGWSAMRRAPSTPPTPRRCR